MSIIEVRPDPADGLLACEAGEWAADKHDLLRQYLDISHRARRKFVTGRGGATYIELFAGPGRLFVRSTGAYIDGSPVVAHREATRTRTTFSTMHLGDEREDFCNATSTRLKALGANPTMYVGQAEDTAKRIADALDPHGLNFAFLDPFGFEGFPFAIVEAFARFKRMDLLIHVSASALQRNLDEFMASKECPLDHFAPGWREVVRGRRPDDVARGMILEHWTSLIRKAGFRDAEGKPLIRGPSNQALYWLVLVAKHELATKFWDAINRSDQSSLFGKAS